jgi:hypothetical protein
MQNAVSGEKDYKATIFAQNLLEDIRQQMTRNIMKERNMQNIYNKGMDHVKSLYTFFDEYEEDTFSSKYQGNEFEYEVYIWQTDGSTESYGQDVDDAYCFIHGEIDKIEKWTYQPTNIHLKNDDIHNYSGYFANVYGEDQDERQICNLNVEYENKQIKMTNKFGESLPSYIKTKSENHQIIIKDNDILHEKKNNE